MFNSIVPPAHVHSEDLILNCNLSQRDLSARLAAITVFPANHACLLFVSSRHAASWLAVIPLVGLNLHLEPDEFQIVLKWWLGINASLGSYCPYCPDDQLDPLGHHAVTCKGGGDVVLCNNSSRDVFSQFCHLARLGGQLEVDCGLGADNIHSRPADILVQLDNRQTSSF